MSDLAQEAVEDDRVSSMPEVDKAAGRVSTQSPKEMENHSETWKTMAPDVDEYNSSAARRIASGSGQIIRGIFWLSFMAVTQLENGGAFFEKKVKPSDTPSHISSQTIQTLHRFREISRTTETVARKVLSGVLRTVGFLSGSVINSVIGKKVFQLMPGEVLLASLDAFGKLFDVLERAGTDIMGTASLVTQRIIAHRFGYTAGQATQEILATAGHVFATVWTIIKLRKAINPKDGALKQSYASQARAAAVKAAHRN
jgi:spartin